MPNFHFPTVKQLTQMYRRSAAGRFETGHVKKLARAPKGLDEPMKKNVGIAKLKGREDLYQVGMEIVIKNTQGQKITWYNCGHVPLF